MTDYIEIDVRKLADYADEDLKARRKLLEEELEANEEEARMLQKDLEEIYSEQDRRCC